MQSSEGDCQSDNNSSSYYDRPVKTDDEVDSREEKLPGTSRQTSKQDKPLKQGDQRRTELNAHTTGRNCCIEWDFRRTLHRVYAGYKQAVNRIEREQEDVSL
ncbi:hypothetical protein D915_006405 [Fasciola hepatica]|uniref:Uncharacterized protein n=1 Tax=Fasciola hepatica TaxID=6192 RepID=A0A4E0RQZ0_FASHE|nr:hypothetical protein D915_006405 [Fasciola hepatica]